ncbi:hypothetical protein B6U81_03245 [Thermoplasmatales archaeon ex4484_30]|nr:MAG: hypothetical protein B6U81_03245 [Thermoplasmatales archaeon ex4484_30]
MLKLIILFIISFSPAIAYTIWIRNTEKYEEEPWHAIFSAFLWGATIAIVAAFILEVLLGISIASKINDYNAYSFTMAVLIAPFAEEFTKPLALFLKTVRKEINEEEDGLIYGAVTGLGFSATENLFYSIAFLSEGILVFLVLVTIRTIGGCLLHASATAFTGYGYGKALLGGKRLITVLPFFFIAIAIHSAYNFIVSFELIGGFASVLLAILFAILCIRYVRNKIRVLDSINA